MTYKCRDYRGAIVCENQRLYDEASPDNIRQSKYCPECGCENPEYFYCNADDDCVGCSECVVTVEWNDF